MRCTECERTKKLPTQTSKVSMPRPYTFNFALGIDVNYIADCEGRTYMCLNLVCLGVGFQVEVVFREGHGTPTSSQCLDAIMQHWVSWAGYPKVLVCDRGLNNRGVLAKEMSVAGVYVNMIGLEAPYQIGKVERKGDIWKKVASKVIEGNT